jgi:hypothetical protein
MYPKQYYQYPFVALLHQEAAFQLRNWSSLHRPRTSLDSKRSLHPSTATRFSNTLILTFSSTTALDLLVAQHFVTFCPVILLFFSNLLVEVSVGATFIATLFLQKSSFWLWAVFVEAYLVVANYRVENLSGHVQRLVRITMVTVAPLLLESAPTGSRFMFGQQGQTLPQVLPLLSCGGTSD